MLSHLSFDSIRIRPDPFFETPLKQNCNLRVGCKRTRTDFCNTSYMKLKLSGWLQTNPNGFLQHLLYELDIFGSAANEPARFFATPPIRNLHFRVGCNNNRADFWNTSYTKLTLSGRLQTNPNGLLQHLLYEIDTFGSAANEPEGTFATPPIRN